MTWSDLIRAPYKIQLLTNLSVDVGSLPQKEGDHLDVSVEDNHAIVYLIRSDQVWSYPCAFQNPITN